MTTVTIPTLTTDRLTLRPYRRADFEAYAAMAASPRAIYMDGPMDRAAAWSMFTGDIACWVLQGYGSLTIEVNGRQAGTVGLSFPPHFPEPECGWVLHDGFEGQGYATEAAAALLAHAFATTDLQTAVSYISHDNIASIRVAERLGAQRDDSADRPDDCLVYRHLPQVAKSLESTRASA
ncbi:MAG: GNAT family N-acetyltransferase [Pseudomonadota bacterium]